MVKMNWSGKTDSSKVNSLNGIISDKTWMGNGYSANGDVINWNMQYVSAFMEKPDTAKKMLRK